MEWYGMEWQRRFFLTFHGATKIFQHICQARYSVAGNSKKIIKGKKREAAKHLGNRFVLANLVRFGLSSSSSFSRPFSHTHFHFRFHFAFAPAAPADSCCRPCANNFTDKGFSTHLMPAVCTFAICLPAVCFCSLPVRSVYYIFCFLHTQLHSAAYSSPSFSFCF